MGRKGQDTMTPAEKKISAFCTRRRLGYEWEDLKNMGRRAVIETLDRYHHAETLKAAQRLKGINVIGWTGDDGGTFRGRIFLHDASEMVRITQAEYDAIGSDYRGVWHDYYGDHPEWLGRRTAMIAGHGTTLFIEGVSFEIV